MREIKNRFITPTPVIFSAKFNPRRPNVSSVIKKHRYCLEADDTLKQLFPRNSCIVAKKRERNLQELHTIAHPYNMKNCLSDLKNHGYKKCSKNAILVNMVLIGYMLFCCVKGMKHKQQKMLYIWLTAKNIGNKKRVLLCLGNLVHQVMKATLNNPSILAQ